MKCLCLVVKHNISHIHFSLLLAFYLSYTFSVYSISFQFYFISYQSIGLYGLLTTVVDVCNLTGATLTKLIGTSAWYAPGAASAMMVEAILNDQKKMIPCSCYLEGCQ